MECRASTPSDFELLSSHLGIRVQSFDQPFYQKHMFNGPGGQGGMSEDSEPSLRV